MTAPPPATRPSDQVLSLLQPKQQPQVMECLLCSPNESKANSKSNKAVLLAQGLRQGGTVEHFPKGLETLKQVASVCNSLQALCSRDSWLGPYPLLQLCSKANFPSLCPPQTCMGSRTRSGNESRDFRRSLAKADGRPHSPMRARRAEKECGMHCEGTEESPARGSRGPLGDEA